MTEKKSIRHIELLDHAGRRLKIPLQMPLYVYSRRALNELMLKRALHAGAELVTAHVKSLDRMNSAKDASLKADARNAPWALRTSEKAFEADFVIVANGAKSSLAESLAHNFSTGDYSSAMGYHLHLKEDFIRIQFLKQFKGYIWTFPRADHVSLGICSKLSEHTAGELKEQLHSFAQETYGISIGPDDYFYSALIPTPELETMQRLRIAGSDWALIGDAAGLVDPITGEGIYFALRSGELLADALLAGHVEHYPDEVREDFGRNHQRAAQLMPMFYTSRFWGEEFTTRMIQFGRASRTLHAILRELFEEQDYIHLKRHLQRQMLRSLAEAIFGLKPRFSPQ